MNAIHACTEFYGEDSVREFLRQRLNVSSCALWRRSNNGWICGHESCETKQTDSVAIRELNDGLFEVDIPAKIGDQQLVATVAIESTDIRLLEWYAEALRRELEQAADMHRLETENLEFAEQTISNLEELSFLKNATRQLLLDDSNLSSGIVADQTLAMLKSLLKASEIQLIVIQEGEYIVKGDMGLAANSVPWLLEHYSQNIRDQPLIRNYCDQSEEFIDVPELRNFMIANLRHGSQILGWIVAINRRASGSMMHNPFAHKFSIEFGSVEAELLSTAASILATHLFNLELLNEKEELLTSTIRALTSALDAKDPYTCGHSERVAAFARRLAEHFELDEEKVEQIYLTGLLHDIGKIGIDDATLSHPGPLSPKQFESIKTHPDGGWAILNQISQLRYVLPGVLYHHERFDGTGYPDGLVGTNIPLDARILAVADAYDAMTSSRPYRDGMSHEKAIGILQSGAGDHWDPDVVQAFLNIDKTIAKIRDTTELRKQAKRVKGTLEADATD